MTPARQQEIERLFREFGKGIGSFALARLGDPELAEEITARVFLQVVRHIDQKRGPAAPWLWAILRNELAQHFRRQRKPHAEREVYYVAGRSPEPIVEMERQETAEHLHKILAELNDTDQQLLGMKFFLNQSNVDIAAALGETPSNVGVRLFRLLRQLRGRMEPKTKEPTL